MRTAGRIASAIAVVGTIGLIVALAMNADLGRPTDSVVRLVDMVGLVVVLCIPLSWVLAILHWGSNSALAERKRAWGLTVVLGFFIGAAVYFYHPRGASSGVTGSQG